MRSVSVILFVVVAGLIPAAIFPSMAASQSRIAVIEDLTKRADVVVVGRVSDLRSEWSSDRSRIFTKATVQVEQLIKGDNPQNSVMISTLGGEVDGVGEVYSHTARFKVDEQVVVFAAADKEGQLRVVSGDEGKLTVTKDELTGLQLVADREPLGVFTARLRRVVQVQSQKQ
jgi:excinuclease UvrABC helicase subunit UvrB